MTIEKPAQVDLEEVRTEGRDLLRRNFPVRPHETQGLTEQEIANFAGVELMGSFGARLRKARLEEGLSLQAVATAAGVTRQTISNYEDHTVAGTPPMPVDRLRALCKRLRIREEWLLTETGPMRAAGESSSGAPEDASQALARELLVELRPLMRRLEDIAKI